MSDPTTRPGSLADYDKALADIAKLEDGWYEAGSKAISMRAIAGMRRVLTVLGTMGMEHGWIVPLQDGGLQVEWHRAEGHLEISVNTDGLIDAFLFATPDGQADGLDLVLAKEAG